MDWEHIIKTAMTLFVVLDPLGNAPIVQGVMQGVAPGRRMRVLCRELVAVLVLLFIFFFLGEGILGHLGISKSSLNISGGIMLFLIAVGMVFPGSTVVVNNGAGEPGRTSATEPFIVPVAVPLIVGPAAISLVMIQSSLSTDAVRMGSNVLAVFLAWAATAILLVFSGKILIRIGKKGTVAVTRLMGTVLVLISVQMVLDGITHYIAIVKTTDAVEAAAKTISKPAAESPAPAKPAPAPAGPALGDATE